MISNNLVFPNQRNLNLPLLQIGRMQIAFVYNFLTKGRQRFGGNLNNPASSAELPQTSHDTPEDVAETTKWRRLLVQAGGVETLAQLYYWLEGNGALEQNSRSLQACAQALAHCLIVTNPTLLPYPTAAGCVAVMLDLVKGRGAGAHELLMYEGALALTNLASVEALREVVVAGTVRGSGGDDAVESGMRVATDLVFEENPLCQRAGLELMCNLCSSETVALDLGEKCVKLKEQKGTVVKLVPGDGIFNIIIFGL